ncbi:MAG: RagB/SusD family nutrient uptake outer membrane protein [Bacteroidales bacterium]|nr:RagB/SusD family nutrient uptake outer membrane protein [Bacteroidales bacterium]
MKSFKYIILSMALFAVCSCGNKWLDLEPSNAVKTEGSVKLLSEAEYALNGIYSIMRSSDAYSGRIMYYGDVTGDDMQAVSETKRTGDYYRFAYTKDNGPSSHWSYLYRIIQNANMILNQIDAIKVGEDEQDYKNDLIGQALALRGLALFDLTRFFGYPYMKDNGASLGVPITKESIGIDAQPSRNSVAECYDAFIDDLEKSVKLLSGSFNKGKFNRWAAMSLLSRAYLYKGENQKALEMAESAIKGAESNGWKLWTNKEYPVAWANDASKSNPGEILFEMVITVEESQGKETMGRLNSYDGYDDMCVTVSFYHFLLQDPDDVRLKLLSFDGKKYAYVNKYQPQGDEDIMDANVPVIRLSETYLIAAEAAVKVGDNEAAVKYLDAIVNRANPAKTVKDQIVTLDDVLSERRKELVAEGHRMFDAIRNGLVVERISETDSKISKTRHFAPKETMSFNWDYFKIVLPIPKKEMDANRNMVQNPGY